MKKTTQKQDFMVFKLILKAGNFKRARYTYKYGQDVYVNPDAEFIIVDRYLSSYYGGDPVVSFSYFNTKNHRSKSTNNAGYFIIQLEKCMTIHRIVAETFLGPIPKGYDIDHIDGDKSNNAVTNLEIVTHAENMRRYYERRRASGVAITYKMHGKWMSKSQTFITPDGEKIPMTEQEYIDHLFKTRGKTAVTRFLKRRGGK